MNLLLKHSVNKKALRANTKKMDVLKLALECHVMANIHSEVFKNFSGIFAKEDEYFNKITRNLSHIKEEDVNISSGAGDTGFAIKELNRLNDFLTPYEKCLCLRRAITLATQSGSRVTAADDLVSIITLLIIRSDVPNWHLNFQFMTGMMSFTPLL